MAKLKENIKEEEMAKKNKWWFWLLQIIAYLFLALGILFFLWLAKNLGWLKI